MSEPPLIAPSQLPLGFRFAAVRAGVKPSGKIDFAIAVADQAATAAAMFTGNRVVAAPVTVGRRHLLRSNGHVRVVAVNSGNANCATGPAGLAAAEQVCAATAIEFGCSGHEVIPSSTGIIGVPLPSEKLVAALPAAAAALGATAERFSDFARAILTTDTRSKVAAAAVRVGDKEVRLAGCAKGAGMIHPQLVPHATMLVYLFTDADVRPADLAKLLTPACEESFNRISIDGDTSTNDTVLLLASGASGVSVDTKNDAFRAALNSVCASLAYQIVDDGEGVTHVVTLEIEGAPTDADALTIAKAIAHSPLVKTAWAGSDPNWGRLISTIGASGVEVDPDRIDIWFGDLPICTGGGRAPLYDEQAAHACLEQRAFTIRIALGLGEGVCRFWTTDLTEEYVHINADYSS
jgi:glutamate N-acetyltransferase/amino-acid N-acetyltransferase